MDFTQAVDFSREEEGEEAAVAAVAVVGAPTLSAAATITTTRLGQVGDIKQT